VTCDESPSAKAGYKYCRDDDRLCTSFRRLFEMLREMWTLISNSCRLHRPVLDVYVRWRARRDEVSLLRQVWRRVYTLITQRAYNAWRYSTYRQFPSSTAGMEADLTRSTGSLSYFTTSMINDDISIVVQCRRICTGPQNSWGYTAAVAPPPFRLSDLPSVGAVPIVW